MTTSYLLVKTLVGQRVGSDRMGRGGSILLDRLSVAVGEPWG